MAPERPGQGSRATKLFVGALLLVAGAILLAACAGTVEPTAEPTVDPQLAQGRSAFQRNCASCHSTEPENVIVGPSLAGLVGRAEDRMAGLDARQYIELSILQPDAYIVGGFDDSMPSSFGKQLTGEELDALVAYLMTFE